MSPIFGHGSIVAGRYRIIAPLGAGASARVFLADDLQLGRRVAIKVLHEALAEDQTFLKRFRAEALSAAALNHPNVMHVYDSGDAPVDSGTPLPYLVMEFVGGGSLRAVLDSGPTLSPSQALVVGLDAARGLEYAHQHGFVHRDIKPANLLFGEEGRLRIADFGLARALAEATWTEPEGVLLGTAKYSAPEQAMGRAVDGRSDVYSLALVLVEAVTGSVPFARDTIGATLMARTERDLEVPRSLGRLAPVLERAGRLDPSLRPDAGEMVIAFFAASEDMDRPKPISLPGAISVEALEQLIAPTDEARPTATPDPAESPTEPQPVSTNGTGAEADPPDELSAGGLVPDRERDLDDLTEIAAPGAAELLPTASVPTGRTPTVTVNQPGAAVAVTSSVASSAGGSSATRTQPRIDISLDDEPTGPAAARRSVESDESDDEPAARRWPWVLATLLIVGALLGGSAYWWFAVRVPTHAVLDVTGMPVDQATKELRKLGFEVTSSFVRQDGSEKDEIVGQKPRSGTELEEGKRVELTVSLGNTLVTVPELTTALDEATVIERITGAGLEVGTRTEPYDEIVPAGYLVSWVVTGPADPSGQVPKGSTIDIVISKGPQPRTMPPGLAGQTLESVTRQLTDLKLGLNVTQEFSDEPVDTVLRLNYADNAEVARDTVVEVVVSKGPELFPIPNVVGQTGADASKTLEQAGFIVSQVVGSPTAPTIATNPPAAEMRVKGTPVIVVTGG